MSGFLSNIGQLNQMGPSVSAEDESGTLNFIFQDGNNFIFQEET